MIKRLITIPVISIVLLSLLLGGCSSKTAVTPGQVFEVKKGDLNINVSSDGHLTMPDAVDGRAGVHSAGQPPVLPCVVLAVAAAEAAEALSST